MTLTTHRCRFLFIIFAFLLASASKAGAEGAKEQLQGTIDGVIEVLRTIQGPEDIERSKKTVRQILVARFDFPAMAQGSLGNRWNDLKGNEQEFVAVFTDFVEYSYMSALGHYQGEKVVYDADRTNGNSAEVDTRVVGGKAAAMKIRYKLHLTDGEWKVYDAVLDDISLVGNYRSQFARVLQTASLGDLIQTLRAKAAGR
ncbi:MAG TPA: ABC transporter substrate-binding protein [Candidatus Binatia bacterium]